MVDPGVERVKDADPESLERDEALLLAVLGLLGHRERGYRPTRPWSRSRLRARVAELGLDDAAYLELVRDDPAERIEAERRLAVSMSRFWRGRELLGELSARVLPAIAAREREPRLWCAGAGRGEEAYTLAMLWLEAGLPPTVTILATDIREDCLAAARQAVYEPAQLRSVPEPVRDRWFRPHGAGAGLVVADEARARVRIAAHDLARDPWPWEIDLLLARYVCFTYWDEPLQREAVARAARSLRSHSWLGIGTHERLPEGSARWFEPDGTVRALHRRRH